VITQTSGRTPVRPFVDLEDLICPGCGEQVRGAPPASWQAGDGLAVAQFSHQDRSALCRVAGVVAEPVEVTR
jgi:hypothetical protein